MLKHIEQEPINVRATATACNRHQLKLSDSSVQTCSRQRKEGKKTLIWKKLTEKNEAVAKMVTVQENMRTSLYRL